MSRIPGRKVLAITLSSALAIGSVTAAAPIGAQSNTAVASISAKDRAEGAKVHPQLLAEFGGAMTGPQATYVSSVGKRISLQSGLSNSANDLPSRC